MARKESSHSLQLNFFEDRFEHSYPAIQKAVKNSWAGAFGDRLFPKIDESIFDPLYSNIGRPSVSIDVLYGACVLQQLLSIPDDELFLRIMTDLTFQYALHATTDAIPPFSRSTFKRFKTRLIMHYIATDDDLFSVCNKDVVKRMKDEGTPVPHFLRRVAKLTVADLYPESQKTSGAAPVAHSDGDPSNTGSDTASDHHTSSENQTSP